MIAKTMENISRIPRSFDEDKLDLEQADCMRENKEDFSASAAIAFALVVLFAVFVIVPLVASGKTSDWPKFLYDFQGLFGGTLAVLAAYLTIMQMREGDRKADQRHSDIQKFAVQAEIRLLERALHPQLEQWIDLLGYYRSHLTKLDETSSWTTYDCLVSEKGKTIFDLLREVYEMFERQQFKSAELLFDGNLTFDINLLCKEIAEVTRLLDHVRQADRVSGDVISLVKVITWRLRKVQDLFENVVASLKRLEASILID
jgi:hypothetical protein